MENKEFEQLEKLLYAEADKIRPPQGNLRAVLSRLPETVTENKSQRYTYAGAEKGRVPLLIINELEKFMSNFWKVALPVGAIAIVIAAVGYIKFMNAPSADRNLSRPDKGAKAAPIEFASAELNEAIGELSDSTVGDDLLIEMEAEDAVYIDYDQEALTSYDNISLVYEQ